MKFRKCWFEISEASRSIEGFKHQYWRIDLTIHPKNIKNRRFIPSTLLLSISLFFYWALAGMFQLSNCKVFFCRTTYLTLDGSMITELSRVQSKEPRGLHDIRTGVSGILLCHIFPFYQQNFVFISFNQSLIPVHFVFTVMLLFSVVKTKYFFQRTFSTDYKSKIELCVSLD